MGIFGHSVRPLCILLAISLMSIASGCCGKPCVDKGKAKQVIAKINNYELTAEDFREETRLTYPNMASSADIDKVKEAAMNQLITKKIMLQEAQRQNFDKDKRFMKEIERYWEQALLKLLINRKIDEFSAKIPATITGEVRQKMLQDELSKWVSDTRAASKVTVYKESLKNIEMGGSRANLQ